MSHTLRSLSLTLLATIAAGLMFPVSALAVQRHPRIDDADIGGKGRVILEYGQDGYDETTTLAGGRDVSTFFNFGYNLNERLQLRGMLFKNELSGVDVLFNPLLSYLDSADGWGAEFRMMLEHTEPALPATPDSQFVPGGSFSVALGFASYGLEAATVDDEMHRFYGRLLYSTDFSEDLHAHTMFSTEHFTSDTKRGNMTSLGIGADYDLYKWDSGRSALMLSANGLIDIYSIRRPAFNTGRVTRFDAGLRVNVNDTFGGYAGYQVVNDTLSDRNSQGFFYGLSYTPKLFARPSRVEAEEPVEGAGEAAAPAESETAAAEAPVDQPAGENGDEEGKGTSSLNDAPAGPVEPYVPAVQIRGNDGSSQTPPGSEGLPAQQGPYPTTTRRISRPPAIENPWELLPVGYDFHPETVSVTSAVEAEHEIPASKSATRELELREVVSGSFRVLTNVE
jgi:opacity protein-like surface antigen